MGLESEISDERRDICIRERPRQFPRELPITQREEFSVNSWQKRVVAVRYQTHTQSTKQLVVSFERVYLRSVHDLSSLKRPGRENWVNPAEGVATLINRQTLARSLLFSRAGEFRTKIPDYKIARASERRARIIASLHNIAHDKREEG